jgi:hypothetical protein
MAVQNGIFTLRQKGDIRLAFFLAVPPLVHHNSRSNLTIQETPKVKACKLVLWTLAEVRRESGGSARITCFQFGKRLDIALCRRAIVLFDPKRLEGP